MLQAFLSHYTGAVPDQGALQSELAGVFSSCREAHPELADHSNGLARALAQRVPEGEFSFSSLATNDLYLCVAVLAGDASALVTFDGQVSEAIARVAGRFRLSSDQRDELGQELLERLLLPTSDRAARLEDYAGKGSLARWLQAVATRTQLNHMRGKKREILTGDAAILEALALPSVPGIEPNKEKFRDALKVSLGTALGNLSTQDKFVLRMAYVDGVRLEGLGRALDVSRATAHRRLTKAREALAMGVEQAMSEELAVPKEKLSSIRRLVQSQISISIGRLLGDGGTLS